jgi:hypothetical protein
VLNFWDCANTRNLPRGREASIRDTGVNDIG